MAETSAILLIKALPFIGPRSSKVVDNASDTDAVFDTALTANAVFRGIPVSGSMIWPAESFPSKLEAVCSDVDTLPSLSMTCGSILFEGSRKCTSQPA
jgi:hypothetical protein